MSGLEAGKLANEETSGRRKRSRPARSIKTYRFVLHSTCQKFCSKTTPPPPLTYTRGRDVGVGAVGGLHRQDQEERGGVRVVG